MKLSQLIKKLTKLKEKHGDLSVLDDDDYPLTHFYYEKLEDGDMTPEEYKKEFGYTMPAEFIRCAQE